MTQTDTVVTGSPGNDTITGSDFNDTINGGDGNDTCQGPRTRPRHPRQLREHQHTTNHGPGLRHGNATELCIATGGVLSLTVTPVGYVCVFNPLNPANRRVQEATSICTGADGTFVNLLPLSYACLLPTTP